MPRTLKRNLHTGKTSFIATSTLAEQQQSAPYPGSVADMLSKMHLHCCRWWSFQIRAVPSRLPLTNLRQDSNTQLAPRLYTRSHFTQCSYYEKSMGTKYNYLYHTFHLSGKTGCCQLCPGWRAEIWRVIIMPLRKVENVCQYVLCVHATCHTSKFSFWEGSSPCAHGALISFLDSRFPCNIFWWHHQYFLLLRTSHLEKKKQFNHKIQQS